MDLEIAANDTLNKDHDMDWYCRCLLRRLKVTKQISKKRPQIQRFKWTQLGIDSEGNSETHSFVVVEEFRASEKVRVVKPVKQWWMANFRSGYGLELPNNMVDKYGYLDDFL